VLSIASSPCTAYMHLRQSRSSRAWVLFRCYTARKWTETTQGERDLSCGTLFQNEGAGSARTPTAPHMSTKMFISHAVEDGDTISPREASGPALTQHERRPHCHNTRPRPSSAQAGILVGMLPLPTYCLRARPHNTRRTRLTTHNRRSQSPHPCVHCYCLPVTMAASGNPPLMISESASGDAS
jgi:hypothetical protein